MASGGTAAGEDPRVIADPGSKCEVQGFALALLVDVLCSSINTQKCKTLCSSPGGEREGESTEQLHIVHPGWVQIHSCEETHTESQWQMGLRAGPDPGSAALNQ